MRKEKLPQLMVFHSLWKYNFVCRHWLTVSELLSVWALRLKQDKWLNRFSVWFFAIAFNSKGVRILGGWFLDHRRLLQHSSGILVFVWFFGIIDCYSIVVEYWHVGFWIIIACYSIVPGYWLLSGIQRNSILAFCRIWWIRLFWFFNLNFLIQRCGS